MSKRSRCGLAEKLRRAIGLPMPAIVRFLEIPRRTWYYHRTRLGTDRQARLRPLVREVFERSRGRYGYRHVHAALRARDIRVSKKAVRCVMREEGLEAARPRHRRYSPYAGKEGLRTAPNLLLADEAADLHDFRTDAPGRVLATDITKFKLPDDGREA